MKKKPKVFSDLYINMVKAGETSGTLDNVMTRYADMAEKDGEIAGKVKSALRYPMIMMGIVPIAFIVLVQFVIPKFETMFAQSSGGLPLPTKFLLGINHFITDYWPILITVIIGTIIGIRRFLSTEEGKRKWDLWKIKAPIFGTLVLKSALARFSQMGRRRLGSTPRFIEICSH